MRLKGSVRTLLPLSVAFLAAACGDSGTDPRALDYQPSETVTQVDAVVGPVIESENVLLGLGAAHDALAGFADGGATASLQSDPVGLLRFSDPGMRRIRARPAPAFTVPADIEGETLVWDVDSVAYVVDETRSDAPANGVRVVYYAMNPFTGRPATPLVALGTIDLTDEDVPEEERLGIEIVDRPESGPVVLLDYTVGYSGSPMQSAGDLTFTGIGSHGTTEFDLTQAFTWSEAEDTDAAALDYQYASPDGSIRVRMDAVSAFEAPSWEDVAVLVDVAGEGREVALDVAIEAGGGLDGEIRLDGVAVVAIGGVDGDPTFSYPDGGSLTSSEVESLRQLWTLVSQVLTVSNALLAPGTLLLLPG